MATIREDPKLVRSQAGKLVEFWQKKFWYHGECVSFDTFLQREAFGLKRAVLENKTWRPTEYRFGHSNPCG